MSAKDVKSKSPHPLSKYTDCAYFLSGSCVRGQNCHYRHCEAARVNANKTPPHVCRVWAANQQDCQNLGCKYAHPDPTKIVALQTDKAASSPASTQKKAPKVQQEISNHSPKSSTAPAKTQAAAAPLNSAPAGLRLKTAVFWDIENCAIPRGQSAFVVANRVLEKLALLVPNSLVVSFSAFANAAKISHEQRIALHRGNVKLCDVPDPKPGAADRVLVEEVDAWCQMVPAPAVLCLVSGDIDFVRRLITYKGYGYTIVLFHNAQAREELKVTAHHAVPWATVSSSNDQAKEQKRDLKQQKKEKERQQKTDAKSKQTEVKSGGGKKSSSGTPAQAKKTTNVPQSPQKKQQQQAGHQKPKQPRQQQRRNAQSPGDDLEAALTSLLSMFSPMLALNPKASANGNAKPSKPKQAGAASPAAGAKKTSASQPKQQQQQQQRKQKSKQGEAKPTKKQPQKKAKVPVYKCGSCSASFGASMSLEQHQEAKKHWSCSVCSKSFNSGDALDQHQTDSDHMQLFCQVCSGGPFKSQKSYDDHKSSLGHWNCPQCDIAFKSEQALTQHQVELGHYEDDSSSSSDSSSEDESSEASDVEDSDVAEDDEDQDVDADESNDWDSSEEADDIFEHLPWDSVDRMFSEKVLERERQLASSRNQPERVAAIDQRLTTLKQHIASEKYRYLVREVINYDQLLLAQLSAGAMSDPAAIKGVKERIRIMEAELQQ